MKHLLQALVVIMFSSISFTGIAQQDNSPKVDTIVSAVWKDDAWQNQSKISFTYNADCITDSMLMQLWDNGWKNSMVTTYSYLSGSYVDTARSQIWTNTKWQDFMRQIYSYTADFKPDTVLIQLYITKWINSTRSIYGYDANGYLETDLEQSFAANKWSNVTNTTYANNADGTVDSAVVQQWMANAWVNLTNTKYTYNGDKTVNTTTTQQWIGGEWVNSEKTTYTYTNGKLVSSITMEWVNNAWVNDNKTNLTYDGSGNLSQLTSYTWDGTDWVNESQSIYSYTTSCTLPLTLLDFKLSESADAVLLNWETSNEVNTKGFNIQRSRDGINFSNIGFVASLGEAKLNVYNYVDKITSDMSGKAYYRLQMLDLDGKYTFSKALYAVIDGSGSLVLYPNPVKDRLVLVVDDSFNELNVRITDQNGRVVYSNNLKNISAGQQNVLDVSRLNKGVYLISISGKNYNKNSKFIKY